MPKPNLSSASLDTLLKLRDEIADILAHRAALLREELSKLGQQIGSKEKFRGGSLKGRKVPVKYRDKSGNTWAGRGAQPVWLREKLKAGAKLEDFAVHKTPKKSKKHRRAKR
jgi:DNA-binding protein H-NS